MKKLTKFFMAALLAGMCNLGYAQDYLGAPKANEKVLEILTINTTYWFEGRLFSNPKDYGEKRDWYLSLLDIAKQKYPNKVVDIRQVEFGRRFCDGCSKCYGPAMGKVVYIVDAQTQWRESVSSGIDKAFRNVREGSRIAIDQVTVLNGMNKEEMKDQIIDILLDKGFKVVAKEYLEKLYEEQQSQQSGIYNDRTTVQENNFSAVGYYVNVKVTETSLRVQVINVSTGEYEGNATINF